MTDEELLSAAKPFEWLIGEIKLSPDSITLPKSWGEEEPGDRLRILKSKFIIQALILEAIGYKTPLAKALSKELFARVKEIE